MKVKEAQKLDDKTIYKFKIKNRRRAIYGVPIAITVMTGYSIYAGCDSLKIAVWYRRYECWNRAMHNLIIPICRIERAEPIEKL